MLKELIFLYVIGFKEIELLKDEEAYRRFLESTKTNKTQNKMNQTVAKETDKISKASLENGIFIKVL